MNSFKNKFVKKSKYQKKIGEDITQCLTCERKCKIKNKNTGFCGTRMNIDGEIHSIIYGKIPAESVNPIEKKPFYNFHPGSTAYTVGTYGCNLSCFWCQNYHLSHPETPIKYKIQNEKEHLSPEGLMERAIKNNCEGVSISFNEPTLLFEYSLDVFKLAKKEGLYTTYVSNGYMTEEVAKDLIDNGLDAINIDIKGGSEMVKKYCGADNEKIWRNAILFAQNDVHVEITNLLIEGFNTDEIIIRNIIEQIKKNLSKSTPLHFTRAFPYFKSDEHGFISSTEINILENAFEMAKTAGLDYVYLGNISGKKGSNTYCPNCARLVIERFGFNIDLSNLDAFGKCNHCGHLICER
ncbi:MAG: Cyclic pyranopterin monophosphate synthase [Promethearchaeota archaeon]|nr:MAG: Cyclic pyranopterin monophosphate synthase [Candidatus Lokiarchaeota archaeon]